MLPLAQISDYLDQHLAVTDIEDDCWNGLQFSGKAEVGKIALAVDAGLATFARAGAVGADMLIVHHGHFWKSQNPSLRTWRKQRFDLLSQHHLSLYACHLPLDRHPDLGNNARLLALLEASREREFYLPHGKNIGWIGHFGSPRLLTDIVAELNEKLATQCLVVNTHSQPIKSIAVLSGSGGYTGFAAALDQRVDLYLTGDTSEIYQTAQDAGLNVIFAGHYATETVGLRALADHLHQKFSVPAEFLDLPTGL